MRYFLFLLFCCFNTLCFAQDTSLVQKALLADSASHRAADSAFTKSFAVRYHQDKQYQGHPYFRFTAPALYPVTIRSRIDKDAIFYAIIVLLLFFAFIRNGFGRYVEDLFRIFFRTTMRQRQIREQMSQSPVPSLLLNVLFVFSLAVFAALLLQHYSLGSQFNFWILLVYCVIALACMYAVKFLSLKFFGWVFGMAEAVDAYIFIVFTANKIMGILLLPVLVVMAFSFGTVMLSALLLGWVLVGALFAYRYVLSYSTIQAQVRISFFHFIIYLCAFEITPLLLINKLLISGLR